MKSTSDLTEGCFRIYQSPEVLVVKHLNYDKLLQFDLQNENAVSEVTLDSISKFILTEQKLKPHALLGVMKIDHWSLLLFVTAFEKVGSIESKKIYSIKEVDFVPITSEAFEPNSETNYYLTGIKALFNIGFYYSLEYDLTQSTQSKKSEKPDNPKLQESLYYNFNYNLKLQLIEAKVNPIFYISMINGYVGINEEVDLSGEKATLTIISRRSRFMAGTLFNCKGIDEQGNTANFVETEQIMKIGHKTFAFVIYRGSPPVFISSNKKDFTKSFKFVEVSNEQKASAIKSHVDRLTTKDNMNIFFINLMSDNVTDECVLNNHFQNLPSETSSGKNCKLSRFDFNYTMEGNDFNILHNYISQFIKVNNSNIQYYCLDTKFKSSVDQTGVIRINCFNSLDRTNVMQAALVWKVLEIQVSIKL